MLPGKIVMAILLFGLQIMLVVFGILGLAIGKAGRSG